MTTEVWKPVSFAPEYHVSNHGRVKSTARWFSGKLASKRWLNERILTGFKTNGYPMVCIRGTRYYIHRLVLEAFVGPCPKGKIVCHNDGSRTNNHVSNLRWDTYQSNADDTELHGRKLLGELCGNSRLVTSQVRLIKDRINRGEPVYAIASEYGVGRSTVMNIRLERTWKHVAPAITVPVQYRRRRNQPTSTP